MQNKPKLYRNPIFIATIIFFLISIIVVVVIMILSKNNDNDNNEPAITDASEEYETLNNDLQNLVSTSRYKDYQSHSTTTRFANAPESYFYSTAANNYSSETLLFASALSILSQKQITPSEISPKNSSFQTLAFNNKLSYQELAAANHNILNYYLDNDAVIIICAKGSFIYSDTETSCVLVYASAPADGIYYISSPSNPTYLINGVTRKELLSNIKESASFYILSKNKIE